MLQWGRAFSSQRRGGWSEEWRLRGASSVATSPPAVRWEQPSPQQAAPPAVQRGAVVSAGDRGDTDSTMASVLHVAENPAP